MTYAVLLLLAVATALPNFLPLSVRSTLPDWATSQTVSLGLDLQGGAHLLLAVDRDDLAQARRNVSTTLRQQLLDFKLDFLRLSLVG
jgi:SecD/SecF fusion protein